MLYYNFSNKNKRSAKVFDYLNASEVWLQMPDAGLKSLMREEAPTSVEKYCAALTVIQRCFAGSVEVQRVKYQYFINFIGHGPSEAKLLAYVAERKAEIVLSRIMADVRQMLGEKRVAEIIKLISKQQAEKAVTSSHGGNSSNTADIGPHWFFILFFHSTVRCFGRKNHTGNVLLAGRVRGNRSKQGFFLQKLFELGIGIHPIYHICVERVASSKIFHCGTAVTFFTFHFTTQMRKRHVRQREYDTDPTHVYKER